MENKSEIKTKSSYSFKKDERLCSKKVIDRLFSEGQSFLFYPLKVVFLSTPLNTSSSVQAGFTVSKKNFKQAVKRNRIKRLMREAYRLNKNDLYLELGEKQLAVFFIYIGKEMPVFSKVEKAIKKAFRQISNNLKED